MEVTKEVNPAFEDFLFDWRHKTYLLVGGYGSSKSYHVALKIILKLLGEKRKCLVVREVYDTIRDSTFALFTEIIQGLDLEDVILSTVSPLQFKFPNGSSIIFKGMDSPIKLKSIHDISLIWIEECSELKYAGYKELLGRARHPSLPIHFILSTNPVSKSNWVYTHFFSDPHNERFILDDQELYEKKTVIVGDVYYHHSTADDNLFLPESYIMQLDELAEYDPDLHRVARRGEFGVNGTLVLPQFEIMSHAQVLANIGDVPRRFLRNGMDFGFEESYNAFLKMAIDDERKWLYIYREYYKNKRTDDVTVRELKEGEFVIGRELVFADSAEPKAIAFYNQSGIRMVGAKKGPNSRLENTRKVKRFKKIICSDECKHTIRELKDLTYKQDKLGNSIDDEFSIDAHTFSAIWYGLDGYEVADIKERGNYSGKGAR